MSVVRDCPTADRGILADISAVVSSLPIDARTVALLTVCAKLLGAQSIGSGPRSITLVAVKRPAFESLDAVRVIAERVTRADSSGGYQARAIVEVRADMQCEIRAGVAGHRPITVFRGECRASDARHAVSIQLGDATDAVIYEVSGTLDGVPQRWIAEGGMPR